MRSISPASAEFVPEAMTRFQVGVVALCIAIAGLDGFDVLVVAFTAPAIARDWALSPAALGGLFSAGLAGMGVGALLVAPLGDRLGRRPAVLLCLVLLLLGMLASAFAVGLGSLAGLRFFTGLGIGGVLANINVVVAENTSARRRDLCIALMAVGYPVGATLGGLASVYLVGAFGWRSVYVFGAAVALVLIPLTLAFLPESRAFIGARGRPVDPAPGMAASGGHGVMAVLRPPFLAGTLAAGFLYFAVMATCYFLLSWTPKLLTDLGLSLSSGISGSLLMNLSGAVGCTLFGFAAPRFGVRPLAVVSMLGLGAMTLVFGVLPGEEALLLAGTLALGFFLNSSIAVLYMVVPLVFPASVRATGTGFAMTAGRVGAVAGPLVAGWLIASGFGRPVLCLVLALPMLVGVAALTMLPRPGESGAVARGGRVMGEA